MSLFEELRRRNVIRVGIAYVLMGWVLLQGADFVLDVAGAPDWVLRTLVAIVALGLPVTLFFAWAFEVTPEGIKREKDVDRSTSVTPETGRKLDRAIIVFLAAAVVLLLADRFFLGGAERSSGGPERDVAATSRSVEGADSESGAPTKSVAVLPFADLSQGGDQEWFADGLAEEILNALARTPDLLVASRTSSFGYKGTTKDILQIAGELGVAHVLEGSVRSAGDRIRVTAQLIRAEDGFHVWSENYDRSPEDMIAIQEDLAQSIAEALETTMDPAALASMARVGTRSVEAYKAYLRGIATDIGSDQYGAPQVLQTLRQFEEATAIDPGFAEAYLRQAAWWKGQLTPSFQLSGATDLSVEGLMERFTTAIDAAIENAQTEIDRRGYLAQKAEVEVRLRDAIDYYETYLEERPNDLPALLGYAGAAEMSGDEASRQRVPPLLKERGLRDTAAATWYLSSAYDDFDPNEVADYGLERLRDWPDHRGILYQTHRALMWADRIEEGASLVRRYNLNYDPHPLMLMRQACIEGRTEDAERAFAGIERGDNDQWRSSAWLGLKILGRDAEARPLLDPIAESSSPYQIASMLSYAIFDPTPHPELMEILEREGILRPPPKELPYRCPLPDDTAIAVLPFVNMSSDPEQEFFSDGISEEILNALAQVPDLKVAGRTSSFAFKGRNEDLRTIGQALGVNHILEGSVRKAGDRVRITAQLIKADDGFHLWSETFDRELTDVFAIQDEIAAAILAELETQLAGDQEVSVTEVDLTAYDQYLKARQLVLERNESSLTRASGLLDGVIAMAPEYAPALALRGIVNLLLSDRTGSYGRIPANEADEKGREYLERALAVDPELPDAMAGLGLYHLNRDENLEAERMLEGALAINPSHVNALNWLQQLSLAMGELRRARQLAERVHELDPLYAPGIGNLAFAMITEGDVDGADAVSRRVQPYLDGYALNFAESIEVMTASFGGREADAIRRVEEMDNWRRTWAAFSVFFAWTALGEPERALPYAEGLSPSIQAYSRLGRVEEGIQRAQPMLAAGEGTYEYVQLLSEHDRWNDIIAFVEDRWPTLQAFADQYPGMGFGSDTFGHLAHAYRRAGNEADFREALRLMKEDLRMQFREGADTAIMHWSQAHYEMLAGNPEGALDSLEAALDRNWLEDPDISRWWPVFQPLVGEPRFQAVREHLAERINEQRALLDLPPLEADT